MDKQKQIEEMARTFGGCHITPNCKVCCAYSGSTDCPNKTSAEKLYNAGYRKIPENAVVLTRGEYERLLKEETLCERLGNDIDVKLKYIYELEDKVAQVRKQTAEKFAERLKAKAVAREIKEWKGIKYTTYHIVDGSFDEICKEIIGEEK